MKRPAPNTKSMDSALIDHSRGGAGVYKPELYTHATREAQARLAGFKTVREWETSRERETKKWWKKFLKGEIN